MMISEPALYVSSELILAELRGSPSESCEVRSIPIIAVPESETLVKPSFIESSFAT